MVHMYKATIEINDAITRSGYFANVLFSYVKFINGNACIS